MLSFADEFIQHSRLCWSGCTFADREGLMLEKYCATHDCLNSQAINAGIVGPQIVWYIISIPNKAKKLVRASETKCLLTPGCGRQKPHGQNKAANDVNARGMGTNFIEALRIFLTDKFRKNCSKRLTFLLLNRRAWTNCQPAKNATIIADASSKNNKRERSFDSKLCKNIIHNIVNKPNRHNICVWEFTEPIEILIRDSGNPSEITSAPHIGSE